MKVKQKKADLKILYLDLYNRLKRKTNHWGIMSKKKFFCILGKTHSISKKNLKIGVMKELEGLGLIKDLGTRSNNNIRVSQPSNFVNKLLKQLEY